MYTDTEYLLMFQKEGKGAYWWNTGPKLDQNPAGQTLNLIVLCLMSDGLDSSTLPALLMPASLLGWSHFLSAALMAPASRTSGAFPLQSGFTPITVQIASLVLQEGTPLPHAWPKCLSLTAEEDWHHSHSCILHDQSQDHMNNTAKACCLLGWGWAPWVTFAFTRCCLSVCLSDIVVWAWDFPTIPSLLQVGDYRVLTFILVACLLVLEFTSSDQRRPLLLCAVMIHSLCQSNVNLCALKGL